VAHAERFVVGKANLQFRLRIVAGQLLGEPLLDTDFQHLIDITRAGAVGQAVKHEGGGLQLAESRILPWQFGGGRVAGDT